MHEPVHDWIRHVKRIYPSYFVSGNILEVGSYDINGSARSHFTNCRYTGIDIYKGKGVDLQESAVDHRERGLKYNVIVCTEVLEHDSNRDNTVKAMCDMLENHGLLIITAAGPMRKEHGTWDHTPEDSPVTLDYYENVKIVTLQSALTCNFLFHELKYNADETDIYFYGIKS